jgi:hypothetical protein
MHPAIRPPIPSVRSLQKNNLVLPVEDAEAWGQALEDAATDVGVVK